MGRCGSPRNQGTDWKFLPEIPENSGFRIRVSPVHVSLFRADANKGEGINKKNPN